MSNTKCLYVIVKARVYRHDILGAYEDLDLAKEAARQLAKLEVDGYHRFEVVTTPLNHLPEFEEGEFPGPYAAEGDVVYTAYHVNEGEEFFVASGQGRTVSRSFQQERYLAEECAIKMNKGVKNGSASFHVVSRKTGE